MTSLDKVKHDLVESQISWKVALAFIPIAFASFLFHEFGHWLFGELRGNDMLISLNNSTPRSGEFVNHSDTLWSAIGGPAFTILQAFIFMLIVKHTKSIYAFSICFFAVYLRYFCLFLGGLNLQDESRIAQMLDVNQYIVAFLVLTLLSLILLFAARQMNFKLKSIGYFLILGTIGMLTVIFTNNLIQ